MGLQLHVRKLRRAAPFDGGGGYLFSDDFKTGYTWGTLPMTSQATAITQMGSNWQYIEWATNHGAIVEWPPDTNKNAYRMEYVNSDDLDVIQHKFDPTHGNGAGRPTEIYWQWKEYRSSTFDFGPSKDFRVGVFRESEYGGSGTISDIYGSFYNGSASGSQSNCVEAGLFIQGAGSSIPQPLGAGYLAIASFVMAKATTYKVELRVKINTPGNTDGVIQLWVDGALILDRPTVKLTPDGWTQGYIDYVQMGMSATNGGQAFSGTSYRYITDVIVDTSYIG